MISLRSCATRVSARLNMFCCTELQKGHDNWNHSFTRAMAGTYRSCGAHLVLLFLLVSMSGDTLAL